MAKSVPCDVISTNIQPRSQALSPFPPLSGSLSSTTMEEKEREPGIEVDKYIYWTPTPFVISLFLAVSLLFVKLMRYITDIFTKKRFSQISLPQSLLLINNGNWCTKINL